ncbi:MAG: hypothetical protein Q9227_002369 [Pyrenula ochraceoflavens]
MSNGIESSIFFMKRDELHLEQKPYAYRFAAQIDIPQSNFVLQEHHGIRVTDIRRQLEDFTLQKNGFVVLRLADEIPYEDFFDPERVKVHSDGVSLDSQERVKLSNSHWKTLRLRSTDFRGPYWCVYKGAIILLGLVLILAVNLDTTTAETLREVIRQHGDEAEDLLLKKRIQWINIWKPLRGPLNDWPLTFCDTSNIDPSESFEKADLLYPEFVIENRQIYYSPHYRWHYLSEQQTNEIIVFKQSDTDSEASPGMP